MVGDPNADFKLGVTNTFAYKGFQLNVLWDMTQGGDFYSETISSMLGRGVTRDTKTGKKTVLYQVSMEIQLRLLVLMV